MRFFAISSTMLLLAGCSEPVSENPTVPEAAISTEASVEAVAEEQENALLGSGGVASRMASARSNQPASTCDKDEEIIFACTMKSGKKASICVTGEGDDKFAQYRFGPDGKPAELAWPMTPQDGKLAFKSVPYSGGGEAQMSFIKGDTQYVVFSRVVRTNFEPGEPNNPAIEDGILVRRGGTVLGQLGCSGEVELPINYDLADKYGEPASEIIYAE